MEFQLQTYPHVPFKEKERPIPFKLRGAVQESIDEMVKKNIIGRKSSPYNNPLVLVPKKSGEDRVCLDARRLNKFLIPAYDKSARIEEVLRKFRGKRWLSSTDITSGYFNVKLTEDPA